MYSSFRIITNICLMPCTKLRFHVLSRKMATSLFGPSKCSRGLAAILTLASSKAASSGADEEAIVSTKWMKRSIKKEVLM